jgi:hypothetical protein
MRKLYVTARIVNDDGKPAKGVNVTVQYYGLSASRWLNLSSGRTDGQGQFKASRGLAANVRGGAPSLRLIENGNPAPRVLAQQARYSYSPNEQLLRVDFGVIERLGDTAFELRQNNTDLAGEHQVAGLPKRKALTTAVLVRHLDPPALGRFNVVGGGAATGEAAVAETVLEGPALQAFNAELIRHAAVESQLKSRLSDRESTLSALRGQLEEQAQQVTRTRDELQAVTTERDRLREVNERYTEQLTRRVPVESVAANIGVGIDRANRELQEGKRPYRFGRVEVNLKGAVSDDGESMTLLNLADLERLKGVVAVPGVSFELLPDAGASGETGQVSVPDLAALTETAARQALARQGLVLEPVYRSVPADASVAVGQAMQQSPKWNTLVPRGSRVLVVFATARPGGGESG